MGWRYAVTAALICATVASSAIIRVDNVQSLKETEVAPTVVDFAMNQPAVRLEREKCGAKMCQESEKCAFISVHGSKKSPKCLPNNVKSCKHGNCPAGQKCATTTFIGGGGQLKLCIPSKLCKPAAAPEKCGRHICRDGTVCAQVAPQGKSESSLPLACISAPAKPCKLGEAGSQCAKGQKCANTKIIATAKTTPLCLPVSMCKRRTVAAQKCGEKTCRMGTTCAQVITYSTGLPSGPPACIPENSKECKHGARCTDKRMTCASTKIFSSGETPHLCVPSAMCKRTSKTQKCGEKTCAPETTCVQAISRAGNTPIGRQDCIPLTTKECKEGSKCGDKRRCAHTKVFSSGETPMLCLPEAMCKISNRKLENCGSATCDSHQVCAQVISHDGSVSSAPQSCVAKTTTPCSHDDAGAAACEDGTSCALTRILSTGEEPHLCVPTSMDTFKEHVQEQCGEKTCGFGHACGRVTGYDGEHVKAPLTCIPDEIEECDPEEAVPCAKNETCARTKINQSGASPFLCTLDSNIGELKTEDTTCGGKCEDGEACRLTLESNKIDHTCLPLEEKACFGNVFCHRGTECGHKREASMQGMFVKQCVAVPKCGNNPEPCKSNEKCSYGTCVPVKKSCGLDGVCGKSDACRKTSVQGALTEQCLPSGTESCGENDSWCPRGLLCSKSSFGKHVCKRPCGTSVCSDTEVCEAKPENSKQSSSKLKFECVKKAQSCSSYCTKKDMKCARVYMMSNGRGVFQTGCVPSKSEVCGNIAVCGSDLTCTSVTSKMSGKTYDRCVSPKIEEPLETPDVTGECACVKTPRCYTTSCQAEPEERCTDDKRLVCIQDLKTGGVSPGAVYGDGSFGAVFQCKKTGSTRQLTYQSVEEETRGRCISDDVAELEEIKPAEVGTICKENCKEKGLKCARVYSEKDGEGTISSSCVNMERELCGNSNAVCEEGFSCKSIRDEGTKLATKRCVASNITVQSTDGSGSNTCSCVQAPKCYKKGCALDENCTQLEQLVCMEDLRADGVFITDVFGRKGFGEVKTCKKSGNKRTFHYKSKDPEGKKQCVWADVSEIEEIVTPPNEGGYETEDTCLCEQDLTQEPGQCSTWLHPGVDKTCRTRKCERSWKCSESQVAPKYGPAYACRTVKILDIIVPTDVYGICVEKKAPRTVVVRVETEG